MLSGNCNYHFALLSIIRNVVALLIKTIYICDTAIVKWKVPIEFGRCSKT